MEIRKELKGRQEKKMVVGKKRRSCKKEVMLKKSNKQRMERKTAWKIDRKRKQ